MIGAGWCAGERIESQSELIRAIVSGYSLQNSRRTARTKRRRRTTTTTSSKNSGSKTVAPGQSCAHSCAEHSCAHGCAEHPVTLELLDMSDPNFDLRSAAASRPATLLPPPPPHCSSHSASDRGWPSATSASRPGTRVIRRISGVTPVGRTRGRLQLRQGLSTGIAAVGHDSQGESWLTAAAGIRHRDCSCKAR